MKPFRSSIVALLAGVIAAPLVAQADEASHVDAALRKRTVRDVGRCLAQRYVFEEAGQACADLLEKRLTDGAYDDITERTAFASALTADLQGLTSDKHLRVRVRRPRPAPAPRGARRGTGPCA